MRYYGLDLRDEFQNAGCRRLWVLVQGLPAEAAVWREDAWTRQDEFAAAQLELTDAWSRLIFSALGGKPRGDPIRIDRPELPGAEQPKKEIETDTQKIAAWFALHS